jgi:hypothetical protein
MEAAIDTSWLNMEGLTDTTFTNMEGTLDTSWLNMEDVTTASTGNIETITDTSWQNMEDITGTSLANMESAIDSGWGSISSIFEDGWSDIIDVFEDGYDDIVDISEEITEGIFAAFDLDWASIGIAITDGITAGINAGKSKVINAAISVAKAAIAAAQAALGISSPSAVAAAEIGAPIPEGIALGITANVSLIINALKDAAEQVKTKGVKEFAAAVKAVADAILKVSEAIATIGNMTFPSAFEEKMRILDYLIWIMMTTIRKAANHFDKATLELIKLYAEATKKTASAIIEIGEMFETIAEIRWPKPGTWEPIWHGLDWLIWIMMTTIRKTALRFDEPTLKLIETYAKTVKKVADAVIAFGESLDIIATIKWPKPGTWEAIFFGLDWLMMVMVDTIKTSARRFDGPTLALIDTYAKAVKGVSNTLSVIVEDVAVAIGHINALVNKNIPGSLQNITTQMITILRNLTIPAANVGALIGDAIVNGIIHSITVGISSVNSAVAELLGNIQFEPPQFPQAVAVGGAVGSSGASSSGRTVVIESGAFQVTISDTMDVEEFEFRTLEILRKLTE